MWLNATERCGAFLAVVYVVQVYFFLKHIDIHDALERPTILDWDKSSKLFAFWTAGILSITNLLMAFLDVYSFSNLDYVLAENGSYGVVGWVIGFLYIVSIVSSSIDELRSYNIDFKCTTVEKRNLRYAREPICKSSIWLPVSVFFISAGNWFMALVSTALHLFLSIYIHCEENAIADLCVDDFIFIPEADVIVDTAVPDRTTHDSWIEVICGILTNAIVDIQG